MRLNLDILAAWLPEQWRIKQFGSRPRELTLARPHLYEPGVAIQADTLYLTGEKFRKQRSGAAMGEELLWLGQSGVSTFIRDVARFFEWKRGSACRRDNRCDQQVR